MFPSGAPAAISVLFFSAALSARPDGAVFYDIFDVFEDSCYAVRFPGWPSGPAAGPSGEIAASLHFSKEFQPFPLVPQLPSVFFSLSAPLSARPDGAVFLSFPTFLKISAMP